MSRCKQCNIEILDETEHCPLCQSVLEKTIDMENMYPNVMVKSKKWAMLAKIYFFCMIVLELILVNVVMLTDKSSMIAIIPGLIFLYGYTVIRYAIVGKTGYRSKVLVLTLVAVLILVAIDYSAGYHGWSVNYIIPAGIMFLDACIFVLMLINRKNWQSYIIIQIMMLLCCVISWILYATDIITQEIMVIIATDITIVLFLGTIILGGRRARVELYRRFHI